jgi:hypothetical protein
MKPARDRTTSLDDPLVSHMLTKLGAAIETVLTTKNLRIPLRYLPYIRVNIEELQADFEAETYMVPRHLPHRGG